MQIQIGKLNTHWIAFIKLGEIVSTNANHVIWWSQYISKLAEILMEPTWTKDDQMDDFELTWKWLGDSVLGP